MSRYWKALPHWAHDTVFIVGGGPSLKELDLSVLSRGNRRPGQRVIAVNNAYRLVPDADALFYADTRWWSWNSQDVKAKFIGERIITTSAAGIRYLDPSVVRMGRDYNFDPRHRAPEHCYALAEDPCFLSGPDSGYMALNLAYHYGASRIVLLGFDMGFKAGEAHWHEDHPVSTPETNYTDLFIPRYPALIDALKQRNVEVLRCTPSKLDYIPEMPLAEALAMPVRKGGKMFDTRMTG